MKKNVYKRLSAMLVVIMIVVGLCGGTKTVFASEDRVIRTECEGYSVEYVSYSDWGTGSNGAILLSNHTNGNIENWEISFDMEQLANYVKKLVLNRLSEANGNLTWKGQL